MPSTYKIDFKNALRSGYLLVFSALFVATFVDQSLNKQIEKVIQSTEGLSNMIWFWGALSLVASLFFPLLLTLLCSHALAHPEKSRRLFIKTTLELGVIETMRAWGKTFIWLFAFIVPGLIKYTYYLLTPFVVMFSKRYANGEVDALEYSTAISKMFWWRLNFWIALFYMILPLLSSSLLDERRMFLTHPWSATLCVMMETVILFTFHFIMLKLFFRYLEEIEPDNSGAIKAIEVPNGTHV